MPNVSVIVPTRHEAATVPLLTDRATAALRARAIDGQVVFVDDSDDATPEVLGEISASRPEVAVLHRQPAQRRGGLAGAVFAGFAASDAPVLAVMDGDLQHPPEVLGDLLDPVLTGVADIAVASRFVGGGSDAGLAGPLRRTVSRAAAGAARSALPRVRGVHDPLSGFFALRREVVDGVDLAADGFKILLEVLAKGHWQRVVEVPFTFEARPAGASKASLAVGRQFVSQLVRLAATPAPGWGSPVPLR
ncbi:MAG TPA: glycosyltransferase [Acidimicrobiales bacterium]|nr:glycosyltransferase [Acidimicrobiales bacterium]